MWEMSTRGYFLFFSLLLVAIAIMVKAGDLGDLNEALEWALWWVDSIAPAVAAVFIAGLWFYTFLSKSSSLHKDRILDSYKSLEEVQEGLRKAGLESSQLIVSVDYTKSNEWTGQKSFEGKCMHDISGIASTPYEEVLSLLTRTLDPFDDDHLIPAYGFGDTRTTDRFVFSFQPNDQPCDGLKGVLERYHAIARVARLSGPTNFAPMIYRAMEIVKESHNAYHILLIICDGAVVCESETAEAIVEACSVPLSIIIVGVGDGPWGILEEYDDHLPSRSWDNCQCVVWEHVKKRYRRNGNHHFEPWLAMHALMELPAQYATIKKHGLLGHQSSNGGDYYNSRSDTMRKPSPVQVMQPPDGSYPILNNPSPIVPPPSAPQQPTTATYYSRHDE